MRGVVDCVEIDHRLGGEHPDPVEWQWFYPEFLRYGD
jgi:hypothetical protein